MVLAMVYRILLLMSLGSFVGVDSTSHLFSWDWISTSYSGRGDQMSQMVPAIGPNNPGDLGLMEQNLSLSKEL